MALWRGCWLEVRHASDESAANSNRQVFLQPTLCAQPWLAWPPYGPMLGAGVETGSVLKDYRSSPRRDGPISTIPVFKVDCISRYSLVIAMALLYAIANDDAEMADLLQHNHMIDRSRGSLVILSCSDECVCILLEMLFCADRTTEHGRCSEGCCRVDDGLAGDPAFNFRSVSSERVAKAHAVVPMDLSHSQISVVIQWCRS